MKSKKTLVILSPGFAENEEDTTCLPAQQLLVKELNNLFPELQIIILAFQYPFKSEEYVWYGNRVIPFNGQNKRKIYRLLLWKKVWKKLAQINKENSVLGIFCFWCTECALVGKYFSKLYSLKHFIWICGQDAQKTNKLVKIINPKPGSLVAISDFLVREFFKNHGITPAHVIPIGIDTSINTSLMPTRREVDIIGVGSLIPLKQYEIFIEIVSQLKRQLGNINAIICGDGPEKEKLKALATKVGLQNHLSFRGKTDHKKVLQLMQCSKILLHPSSYEGFGAVCMEALYAGAHVISFCRPMRHEIKQWHVVNTKQEMSQKALDLLQDTKTEYERISVQSVTDTAIQII